MGVRWRLRFWGGYVLSQQVIESVDLRIGDVVHLPSSPQISWAGVSGMPITSVRGKVNIIIETTWTQHTVEGPITRTLKHKVPRTSVAHVLRDGIIYRVDKS